MVTEPRRENRSRDARNGDGVAGRFRPLGSAGDAPERATDPSPPGFATAPWGYRRREVDAWAAWVAGLVAHGRNETVRADSAEATLRATLERLEQVERPAGRGDAGELPRRNPTAHGADESGYEPGSAGPVRTTGEQPATEQTGSAPGGPDPAQVHDTARSLDTARLQVVETTLREVMRLLHRLVGPEQAAPDAGQAPPDT